MTNKEKYKQAFSVLHMSKEIPFNVISTFVPSKKIRLTPALIACLCVTLLLGSMTAAYAADIGGIRSIVYAWIHGTKTEVEIKTGTDGGYDFIYQEDGTIHRNRGGGIGVSDDGREEGLSADDVIQGIAVQLDKKGDGSIFLYYHNRAIDVTDYLIDNACKIYIIEGNQNIYFDIEMDDDGFLLTSGPKPAGLLEEYVFVG